LVCIEAAFSKAWPASLSTSTRMLTFALLLWQVEASYFASAP
jgi:hypothetical protein